MTDQTKPLIVLTCTPGAGHVNPITTIARALILDGYQITAVSATGYRQRFEDVGCSYVAIQGYGDYVDEDRETKWPERASMPPGPEQFAWTVEQSFIKVIPDQLAAVQKAIAKVKDENPGRPVIVLNESAFLGSLPLLRGARGVKADGIIGIGITPISLTSVDTAPYNMGLPPPTSPEQTAQYSMMLQGLKELFTNVQKVFNDILRDAGGEPDETFFNDAPSDAPKSVRFAGGMPKLPQGTKEEKPAWWDEVAINSSGKDIVFVCQGTVRMDYNDIVVPAIEALKDRPNTLVIVALGQRGAVLDPTVTIPENTRVVDYIPFDDILPLASVFVGNGGYGGVRASLANGTPLVVAGDSEDKPEMCAIIEWAGVAVNLRTGNPTSEALRDGVDKVLSNSEYTEGAKRIQADMDAADPVGTITQNINEVLAGIKAE
ncbi:putative udp-glucuronosyltransferase 2a3 [Fusarium sporotrichioides]|uniref:Putative udp-glucuronosyltransferase 2a3 n=1 Tax=Fusarium sporotrichioides TaxID=5514 RepID=A0A395RPJ1_FUSSP|nr:putative udp-glucuronosyltransferase 2a3 [Fusarium sporotrichioides]